MRDFFAEEPETKQIDFFAEEEDTTQGFTEETISPIQQQEKEGSTNVKDFFAEEEPEKQEISIVDRFTAGLEKGVSGELTKALTGNLEDSEILKLSEEDPNFWEGMIMFGGEMLSDAPYLAAGATAGGLLLAPVGGAIGSAVPVVGTAFGSLVGGGIGAGAGSLGFTTFMKESLKEYRNHALNGNDLTFGEFIQQADRIGSKTLTSGLLGSILYMVQVGAPLLKNTKIFNNLFKTKIGAKSVELAAEAAALTSIPALSEGRLPTIDDLKGALTVMGPFQIVKAIPAMKNAIVELKDTADYNKTIKVLEEIHKLSSEELTSSKLDEINEQVEAELVKEKSAVAKDLIKEKKVKEEIFEKNIEKDRDVKVEEAQEEIRKVLKKDEKFYEKAEEQDKVSNEKLNKEIKVQEEKYIKDVEKANTNIEEGLDREVEKVEKKTTKIKKESDKEISKIEDIVEKQKIRVRKVEEARVKQQEKLIDSQEKTSLKLEETKRNHEKKASDKRFEKTTAPKAREKLAATRRNQATRYREKVKAIEEEAAKKRKESRKASDERVDAKEDKIEQQAFKKQEKLEQDSNKKIEQLNKKAIDKADKMRQQELKRVERSNNENETNILNKAEARDKKLKKGQQKTFDEYKAQLQKANDKINSAYAIAAKKKAKEASKLKKKILNKWSEEKGLIEEKSRPRIEKTISNRKSVEEQVSIGETQKVAKKEKPSFKTEFVDEFYPLERITKELAPEGLPISQDPYKLARLSRGSSGKTETFLMYNTFDPITLKSKNKGLINILKPIRNQIAEFSKYLAAERAIELNKFGKETGIDIKDAERIVSRDNRKFAKAKHELDVYQKDILDYAEKAGLLSSETRAKFDDMYKNYVPLKRVIEDKKAFIGRNLNPKEQFFRLEGSDKPIVDPLESVIQNTYMIIRTAEQNMVTKSLVDLIEAKKGIGRAIETIQGRPVEENLLNMIDFMEMSDSEKGTISYFDNGVKRTYEVPNDVADAIQGLTTQEFGFWTKVLTYPTRAIRLTAVQLNPTFLVKNIFRDQAEALMFTKNGYIPFVDMARGLFHAMKKDDLYYKWKAAGGDQSFVNSVTREVNQKKLRHVSGNRGATVLENMQDLGHALESIPDAIEKSTRLGEFKKSLQRNGMSSDDLREAALQSREITLDFAKKGARTQLAVKAVPFFNAHIQGLDKFYQEIKNNPSKLGKYAPAVAMKGVTYLTLPTLALWYKNKDDERYQELPDYEKNKNWHLFFPTWLPKSLQHFKIAKPFELGSIFATLPERIAQYIYDNNPEELDAALFDIVDTMMLPYIPAIAQPGIESFGNKSLHTGAPIIPLSQQMLPPELQQTAYTSETAKLIGKGISKIPYIGDTKTASPVEVDHWITAWSGDFGRAALAISDKILAKAGIVPEVINPEKELGDYPILKVIIGKETSGTQSKSIRKFYDISEKISKYFAGKKELRKRDKESGKEEYSIYHKNKAKRIRRVFSRNFKLISDIRINPTMTPAEKKIQIDQLAADMTGVARQFLSEMKEDKD
jgi:hypothetical protein